MLRLIALLALFAPAPVLAAGWGLLAEPNVAVLMRHALAPGVGDPSGFRLDDPATQRNLDAHGRAQARAAGEAIRAAGIEVDAVLTSGWNRARETADLLGVAPVEPVEALGSFFADRSARLARTEALQDLLRARAGRERLVLVTHQVNIAALTGRALGSGDAVAVAIDGDQLRVLDVIYGSD